jgi:hypothetical protein
MTASASDSKRCLFCGEPITDGEDVALICVEHGGAHAPVMSGDGQVVAHRRCLEPRDMDMDPAAQTKQ